MGGWGGNDGNPVKNIENMLRLSSLVICSPFIYQACQTQTQRWLKFQTCTKLPANIDIN